MTAPYRSLSVTLAVAAAAWCGCSSGPTREAAAAAAAFFRPGPAVPADLPADGIFPQGRTMHIGGYSVGGAALKQLGGLVPMELAKTSGFTVAGPYYGAFEGSTQALACAAALGLHAAIQLEVPPALHFAAGEDPLKLRGARMATLPEEDLHRWVKGCMDKVLTNPVLNRAVSCWAIAPEELRCWRREELAYEQAFLRAVNASDPRQRPAFMYEPNNRDTNALLKTGPGQGFVLEGAYVHGYGWDVRRALRINWAMDQMTGAAAADKRAVVPGLELSQDMPGFAATDLAADPAARGRLARLLRHDVYLAVVRGAQGFQVWSLHPFRKNLTTWADLVRGYGGVFRELTAEPLRLQDFILFGERRADLTLEVVEGPAFIAAKPGGGTLEAVEGTIEVQGNRWPSVRLANLALGDARVLIAVNSAGTQVRACLRGLPASARADVLSGSDAAKLERKGGDTDLALEPFAALVVRVTRGP